MAPVQIPAVAGAAPVAAQVDPEVAAFFRPDSAIVGGWDGAQPALPGWSASPPPEPAVVAPSAQAAAPAEPPREPMRVRVPADQYVEEQPAPAARAAAQAAAVPPLPPPRPQMPVAEARAAVPVQPAVYDDRYGFDERAGVVPFATGYGPRLGSTAPAAPAVQPRPAAPPAAVPTSAPTPAPAPAVAPSPAPAVVATPPAEAPAPTYSERAAAANAAAAPAVAPAGGSFRVHGYTGAWTPESAAAARARGEVAPDADQIERARQAATSATTSAPAPGLQRFTTPDSVPAGMQPGMQSYDLGKLVRYAADPRFGSGVNGIAKTLLAQKLSGSPAGCSPDP